MRIAHIAIWTERLETLRDFYAAYFGAAAGAKYTNPAKGFESYMLTFGAGCSLELMRRTDIRGTVGPERIGLTHLAFGCDDREAVCTLTERLRRDGHPILSEPRTTGDGFFESVVADPDGNRIELTC